MAAITYVPDPDDENIDKQINDSEFTAFKSDYTQMKLLNMIRLELKKLNRFLESK